MLNLGISSKILNFPYQNLNNSPFGGPLDISAIFIHVEVDWICINALDGRLEGKFPWYFCKSN